MLESRWYQRADQPADRRRAGRSRQGPGARGRGRDAGRPSTPSTPFTPPCSTRSAARSVETEHAGIDGGGQPLLHAHGVPARPVRPHARGHRSARHPHGRLPARHARARSRPATAPTAAGGSMLGNVDGEARCAPGTSARTSSSFTYDDPLHRPTAKRVRGGDGPQPLDNVFELIVYGEGRPGDRRATCARRIALHYDTAGRTEHLGFDFKGNLLGRIAPLRHRLPGGPRLVRRRTPTPRSTPRRSTPPAATTRSTGSPRAPRPTAASTRPATTRPTCSRRSRVTQDGGPPSSSSRTSTTTSTGQRRRIVFGNDVTTDYLHDRRDVPAAPPDERRGGGPALQDLRYTYDPVGNLTHLVDALRARRSGSRTRWSPASRRTATTRSTGSSRPPGASTRARWRSAQPTTSPTRPTSAGTTPPTSLAWQTYTERYQLRRRRQPRQSSSTRAPATPGLDARLHLRAPTATAC